jgi:hypothetical protein
MEPTIANKQSEQSTRLVLTYNWRAHWLTAQEFARVMGRRPQTIYWWIGNGTLAEFGIPICEFKFGRKHSARFFIQNPYI